MTDARALALTLIMSGGLFFWMLWDLGGR